MSDEQLDKSDRMVEDTKLLVARLKKEMLRQAESIHQAEELIAKSRKLLDAIEEWERVHGPN